MKIPNLEDEFKNAFSGSIVSVDEVLKTSGRPIFTIDDVRAVSTPLDRILRMVFVKNRVTYEYFNQCCRKYAIEVLHSHQTQINSVGSNIVRTLQKGNISHGRFFEALVDVLGYKLIDLKITFQSDQGEMLVESLSQIASETQIS